MPQYEVTLNYQFKSKVRAKNRQEAEEFARMDLQADLDTIRTMSHWIRNESHWICEKVDAL